MNNVHILNIHIILFLILIFGLKKKKKIKSGNVKNFARKQNKTKKQMNHAPIINIHITFC